MNDVWVFKLNSGDDDSTPLLLYYYLCVDMKNKYEKKTLESDLDTT
jgi:hypothetical protein